MDEANRRKLEFKKLLIRLGEKMAQKDVENILFLNDDVCQDLPRPVSVVDLFRELLQKSMCDVRYSVVVILTTHLT